ncbi:MAG: NUDIX hydrolase [Patescibacteria group bacterium]|nr:NUDIX hydrolase [Patescibacteria group bacterium]
MTKINYTNEDLIDHHAIAAVIKNKTGEVLVQEHIKYGFWTIPVGKVKKDQSITDGLKQEVFEECNLEVESCREVVARNYLYYRNGSRIKVMGHLFEIIKYKGELQNLEPQKHKQQLFVPVSKIIKLPYLSDLTLLYLDQLGLHRLARL